jgi:7-cyano-7-deazaguanine synthase
MIAMLLSGGPDSTVLAHRLVSEGVRPLVLTLNLGDREAPTSIERAAAVAQHLGLDTAVIDVADGIRRSFGKPYPQFMRMPAQIHDDVEPFGSGVALSLASSFAASRGCEALLYGVHGDDAMYRDNVPEYFEALSTAISIELGRSFTVAAPFLGMSKPQVLRLGDDLGVDLASTWSCAVAGALQCGACLPCTLRQEAFVAAGLTDATTYATGRPRPTGSLAAVAGA